MADTDQQELGDPDSKQYKINHQDWRKSKAGSPGFDEDKTPPRGRGRGWRNRAKDSPTPGSPQSEEETSRSQRSSDKQTDTRREDRAQNIRREEEEKKKRLQEDRRREDERKWEEERGWKGGIEKEVTRQRSNERQIRATKEAPRQPPRPDVESKKSLATDKSRKARRPAQEVYVPRSKREPQQVYVPRARRLQKEAEEKATASSPDKDVSRTANPREPPQKKRNVADHKEQRQPASSHEVEPQKMSRRSGELRHKRDKYQDADGERRSLKSKSDRRGSRGREGRNNDRGQEQTHRRSDGHREQTQRSDGHREQTHRSDGHREQTQRSDGHREQTHRSDGHREQTQRSDGHREQTQRSDGHREQTQRSDGHREQIQRSNLESSGKQYASLSDRFSSLSKHERDDSGDVLDDDDEMDVSKPGAKEEIYGDRNISEFFREPKDQISATQDMELNSKQLSESCQQDSNFTNNDENVNVGETQVANPINEFTVVDHSVIVDANERTNMTHGVEDDHGVDVSQARVDVDVCQSREDMIVSDQVPADQNKAVQSCENQDIEDAKSTMPDSEEMEISNQTGIDYNTGSSHIPRSNMDIDKLKEVDLPAVGIDVKNDKVKDDEIELDEGEKINTTEMGDACSSNVKNVDQVQEQFRPDAGACQNAISGSGDLHTPVADPETPVADPDTPVAAVDNSNDLVSGDFSTVVIDTTKENRTKADEIISQPEPDVNVDVPYVTCDSTKAVSHIEDEVLEQTGPVSQEQRSSGANDGILTGIVPSTDKRTCDSDSPKDVNQLKEKLIEQAGEVVQEQGSGELGSKVESMSEAIPSTDNRTRDSDSTKELMEQASKVVEAQDVDSSANDETLAETVPLTDDIIADGDDSTIEHKEDSTGIDYDTMQDAEDVDDAVSGQDAMEAEDGSDVDEDSWDALFDDTGVSLKPEEEKELAEGIGKVKVSIKKAKRDYYNYQPKDNMEYHAFEHVIEVYDFPADFKTPDLVMSFSDFKNKGFDIKWVDDTHALAIFATPLVAQDALSLMNPMFRTRPLCLATRESKMKAKKSIEFLQPYKSKPQTTAVAARRLVSAALGLKSKVTKEQREAERQKLREAKDKKRADKQATVDIWEGNI